MQLQSTLSSNFRGDDMTSGGAKCPPIWAMALPCSVTIIQYPVAFSNSGSEHATSTAISMQHGSQQHQTETLQELKVHCATYMAVESSAPALGIDMLNLVPKCIDLLV